MSKLDIKFAMGLYAISLMEQEAFMLEQGSIFSINDPELRALELSNASLLREKIATLKDELGE